MSTLELVNSKSYLVVSEKSSKARLISVASSLLPPLSECFFRDALLRAFVISLGLYVLPFSRPKIL